MSKHVCDCKGSSVKLEIYGKLSPLNEMMMPSTNLLQLAAVPQMKKKSDIAVEDHLCQTANKYRKARLYDH